nr:hypothetical protein [Tanacetum cinerariifolium]
MVQQVLDKCSTLVLRIEGLETANSAQQLEIIKLKARVKKLERLNKGKGFLVKDPKPMKKKDQIEMDAKYVRKLQEEEESHIQAKDVQAKGIQNIRRYHGYKKKPQSEFEAHKNMIDYLKNTEGFKMAFFKGKSYHQIRPIFQVRFHANMRFLLNSREEMEKQQEEIIKSINETPAQKAVKRRRLHKQAKEDENLKKQLEVVVDEDDDVFVKATPIGRKVPVNFDREDLEDLWKIVKARFSTSKPTNFSDDYLLATLKNMFEKTDSQDVIWKSQQTKYGQALSNVNAVRLELKLFKDAAAARMNARVTSLGMVCLPNEEIFAGLAQMGYEKPSTKLTFYKAFFSSQWMFLIHTILQSLSAKRTSWNEFSTTMASVVICLSNRLRFNFSRYIFDSLVPAQDDVAQENVTKEIADDVAQPTSPLPPSPVIPSSPPHQSPRPHPPQAAEGSYLMVQQVLDKCSALVLRIEGLETANSAQQLEIIKLKARVKKLERLNKVKSSKLRHLKKVGTSQCIESSEDEENVIPIPAAKPAVAAAITPISAAKPASKPKVLKIVAVAPAVSTKKRKGVIIRDPKEELHDDTPAETLSVKDKGKGILVEDPKPMNKKDKIEMDAEYARKLQEEEESHVQAKDVQAKDVQAKGIQYIRRYHGYKKKPQSESEARKNMIDYLKNTEGFKMAFFKGKSYDQIRPIFQVRFDANMRFLLKSREEMEKEQEEIIKSINETPAQKAAKRRRLRKQAKEDENLKKQLEVVVDEDDDVFVKATPIGRMVPVLLELMLLKISKENTKCVSATGEELTAAKHKLIMLELKLFRDAAAARMNQCKFLIHTILQSLSTKRTSWNEFSTTMASAVICLSNGLRFNFSRVGKGFSGVETPLFENMLGVREVDAEEEVQVPAQDDVAQENVTEEIADDVAQPTSHLPPSPVIPPSPPHQSPRPHPPQAAEGSSLMVQQVLDKCSTLVLRIEGLETANSAQQLEIIKLKARVKKLERLNKVKGRQADTQAEIYNIDLDHTSKVLSMHEDTEVQKVVEVVNAAKLITEVVTAAATTAVSIPIPAAKHAVAAAITTISAAKPASKPKVLKIVAAAPAVSTKKRKGVIIRDPKEELHDDTPAETLSVKDKGKGILVEDPKPMKKKDQIEMDAEYARKLQEEEESHVQAKDVQAKDVQAKDVQAKGIQYIRRYNGYKKKSQSKSEACKNMIDYLKNTFQDGIL